MILEHIQAYILERRLQNTHAALSRGEEYAIAQKLQTLPKSVLPTPHKRRTYLQHPAPAAVVAHGLHLAQLATRIAGATLVVGLATTSLLAYASKPGSTLYAYKNRTQDLRLMFVASESKQAALRLSYVEDRLEATRIVMESNADSDTKTAALSELSKQTQATVEAVKQVALNQRDTTLLDRLQTITDKQTAVITNTTDPAVQPAAQAALKSAEAGTKQIAEAKRLVIASNEAALAKLPTPISLEGTVSKVTVDAFQLNTDTVQLTKDTLLSFDESLAIPTTQKASIQNGAKVIIRATQNADKTYTALSIVITSLPGKVKGTTSEEPIPTTPEEIENSIPEVPESEQTPPTVQTGFLIENPAPIYGE